MPVSRRLLLGAVAAALVVGCLSPTLPLPPPSKPVVEGPDQEGMVTLDGFAHANSSVYAANLRTKEIRGQITGGDGHYRFVIPAEVGDEMVLWYSIGTEESPAVTFLINAPP